MDNEFWKQAAEDGSLVIKSVSAIAVFRNPSNDDEIVIRQDDPLGDEDDFVIIPIESLPDLIKALQKAAEP